MKETALELSILVTNSFLGRILSVLVFGKLETVSPRSVGGIFAFAAKT